MCHVREAGSSEGKDIMILGRGLFHPLIWGHSHGKQQAALPRQLPGLNDDTDDGADDESDTEIEAGARIGIFLDMSKFEAPSSANKKHAQVVSFLKVGLVQGAELQAQVADLSILVAAIQGALLRALGEKQVAVPAQGRSQPPPGVPTSSMSEWYNRAANTMFWMPLYQVQATTTSSTNPKVGASVVKVDELMKDSEGSERSWAGIKALPPPAGSSTVSAPPCIATPVLGPPP